MKVVSHKPFEYSKITDWLFIGTNECCKMHFNRLLIKQGIRADISLEKIRLDAPFGIDYYLWLPTADHHSPSLKQLQLGVQMIDFCVSHRMPVFLHCRAGHGRAPTLAGAYLMSIGWSQREAVSFIKKRRPITHLSPQQSNGLKNFERWMKQ